jgi:hypothetical protein
MSAVREEQLQRYWRALDSVEEAFHEAEPRDKEWQLWMLGYVLERLQETYVDDGPSL